VAIREVVAAAAAMASTPRRATTRRFNRTGWTIREGNRSAQTTADDPLRGHLKRLGLTYVPGRATAAAASRHYEHTARLDGQAHTRGDRVAACSSSNTRTNTTRRATWKALATLQRSAPFLAGATATLLQRHRPPGGLGTGCTPPACDAVSIIRAAVQPKLGVYERCAVVSSSRSLMNAGLGACIDGFDGVMRFNDAPLVSRRDLGAKTTWRLSTYSPWRVVTDSERLGSGLFTADHQLLYCHNHWLGVCQTTPAAKTINPTFVNHAQRFIAGVTRGLRRPHGEGPHRPPSSGMLGVALALVLCNHTTVFGMTAEDPQADRTARRRCAKYFDWISFGNGSSPRQTRPTGRRGCITAEEYFHPALNSFHSWSMEREVLRTLHGAGVLHVW